MPDKEEERKVVNRMDKRLLTLHMEDVQKAVIKMVKDEDLDPTKLKNDDKFHARLYPYLLERKGEEWEGAVSHPKWEGSVAYKHVVEHIHNKVKNKGAWVVKFLKDE